MNLSKSIEPPQVAEEQLRNPGSTWAGVIDSYFRSNHDLKPLAAQSYRASFNRFGSFTVARVINDLSADNVNAYLASVADHRYQARRDGAGLKVLSKWCLKARYFQADPLAAVKTPRVPKWRPKPLPDLLVPQVLKAAAETNLGPRDRAIVLLALATAARPNELRQLRWPEDVDLRGGVIHIREETSKTESGERVIPLDPQVIAALDEYVSDSRPDGVGPLFLHKGGEPFTYYGFLAVHYRLRDRLRKAGINGYQAYRLRHSGITNFVRAGYSMLVTQQLAGHKTTETTKGYFGGVPVNELKRLPSAFSQVYGRV